MSLQKSCRAYLCLRLVIGFRVLASQALLVEGSLILIGQPVSHAWSRLAAFAPNGSAGLHPILTAVIQNTWFHINNAADTAYEQ